VSLGSDVEIPNRSMYNSSLIQKKQRRDDVIDDLKRISFKEPCEEEVARKLNEKSKSYMETISANLTDYPAINKKPKGKSVYNPL
jgi:hypothetical protein